jgi:hypothetical protein
MINDCLPASFGHRTREIEFYPRWLWVVTGLEIHSILFLGVHLFYFWVYRMDTAAIKLGGVHSPVNACLGRDRWHRLQARVQTRTKLS